MTTTTLPATGRVLSVKRTPKTILVIGEHNGQRFELRRRVYDNGPLCVVFFAEYAVLRDGSAAEWLARCTIERGVTTRTTYAQAGFTIIDVFGG